MTILINEQAVTLPTTLSQITLGQRIDFYNQYGRELDEMAGSILEMEDGPEKELEAAEFQFEKMFRTFAFFAGTTPEALKESEFIDDIARLYYASLAVLMEDEQAQELQLEHVWNGEEWEIHPPELKQGSRMMFGEFIDAKQMLQDMMELGRGRWESLQRLCAIYLRKKGEAYREEFLYEDSERLALMRELPMDIALQVGFFLSSSLNMYMNTLQSSTSPASREEAESTPASTSSAGDGSTS